MRTSRLLKHAWMTASLVVALAAVAHAQSADERARRTGEFLRRIDDNHDGRLEPREVSDRAKPYVERTLREIGLDPSRTVSIREVEERVRRQSGSREGGSSAAGGGAGAFGMADLTVPGFGQVEDQPPIPGFGEDGPGGIRVEQADLERAGDRMRSYDKNRDGYLDREEMKAGRWSDDPFQYDRNRDNRISLQELATRYAVRRVNESNDRGGSSSSSGRQDQGRGSDSSDRRDGSSDQRRSPTSAEREAWALAESMMDRYDLNNNRALDRGEWGDLDFKSSIVDANGDERVDRGELAQWLLRRSGRSQRMPEGLPDWFVRRDADGDGQVDMSEYADQWDEETADEFVQYDRNGDGVIVPDECLSASNLPDGAYVKHQLEIIPARGSVYSEIVVPENDRRRIADLNVQLSITHTHDDYLDVYLVGPGSERVELFTGVGGNDDHFSNTILDDDSSWPIVRARPPFAGRYRPEAAIKEQPSLNQFRGRPIAGTWTLLVQADRSDRPGALHGWSLIVQFEEGRSEEGDWADGEPRSDPRAEEDRRDEGRDERGDGRSEQSRPWWQRR